MTPGWQPLVFRLLTRFLPGPVGQDVITQLRDSHAETQRARGAVAAARWLFRQVVNRDTVRLALALRRREAALAAQHPALRNRRLPAVFAGALVRQLTYAVRGLVRRPALTLSIVLTLALGIGANTAVFSAVHGVLLAPLPYPGGDRLVFVWGQTTGDQSVLLSGPQTAEVVDVPAFDVAAPIYGFGETSFEDADLPRAIRTLTVGHRFFELLGVQPLLGRGFHADDEFKLSNAQIRDPDFERPVGAMVLSHRFWQRVFASDPAVLGRIVRLSGHRHQIVGVMPEGFRVHLPAQLGETIPEDVWVLSPFDQPSFPRDTRFVRVIGRLPGGATLSEAQGALDTLAAWQRSTYPEDRRDEFSMRAAFLQAETATTARSPLLMLFAAAGLVLLIACANVAVLLLVRADERTGEMRVRQMLGAGRWELAGFGIAESALAALAGGAIGAALAPVLARALVALAPAGFERAGTVGVDGSVLAFSATCALVVALLTGLLPALRSVPAAAASSGSRLTRALHDSRTGRALVTIEVALAVVLVIGTGLLLRSLGHVLAVDPGFEVVGLQTWRANLTTPTHPTWESRVRYFRAFQEVVRREPGVSAAGVMVPAPFEGIDGTTVRLGLSDDAPELSVDFRRAGPGALEALGVRLLQGRLFDWPDLEDFDRLYAVVDDRFARTAWPGEPAVGHILSVERREYGDGSRVWDDWKRVEVIGVVASIRSRDLRLDDRPTVYVTYSQNMWGRPVFVARTSVPLNEDVLRRIGGTADPGVLVSDIGTLDSSARERLELLRFTLTLIGVFGAIGLVLAATGVYGLLAFSVSQRARELSLRAALGASRRQLSGTVMRSGLRLTAIGVGVGWVGAWWLTRFIDALLFGVTATDVPTYGFVAVFLVLVAAAACWFPARRAWRTDPAGVLR